MFRSLVAVAAAAICAAIFVGFVPQPAPAVAAAQPAERVTYKAKSVAAARVSDVRGAGCTQPWPYYEQSCLHDGRLQNGSARIVRVVVADKSGSDHALQARR